MARLEMGDVVRSILDREFEYVHTAMPGIVISTSNYESEGLVDIQLAVNRVFTDNVEYEIKPLYDVPVVLLHGGGGIITVPVKTGDTVMVMFSERSIAEWLGSDGSAPTTPLDKRRFSLSDAIAIPGLFTTKNGLTPNPDDVQIRFGTTSISLRNNNGNIDINTESNVNITAGGNAEVTATNVNVHASETNLGDGGQQIARVGDSVEVSITSGSSSGTWSGTITSGGTNTSI